MKKIGVGLRKAVQSIARRMGVMPQNRNGENRRNLIIASAEDQAIVNAVKGHTLTNPQRIQALLDGIGHVVARDIPGALVECGVWRGGSVLTMLLKLKSLGINDRDVYLYDTFEGMTEPTPEDTSAFEPPAFQTWKMARQLGKRGWDQFFGPEIFTEKRVRDLLLGSGYPENRLHFVKGPVEETIPKVMPERIALLRLDTDWYQSTRHELEHLYPRVSESGVLIIDDYGHWEGCRKAVDEYFSGSRVPAPLLNRIDYSARMAIKA